jgi:hypothetical protein
MKTTRHDRDVTAAKQVRNRFVYLTCLKTENMFRVTFLFRVFCFSGSAHGHGKQQRNVFVSCFLFSVVRVRRDELPMATLLTCFALVFGHPCALTSRRVRATRNKCETKTFSVFCFRPSVCAGHYMCFE